MAGHVEEMRFQHRRPLWTRPYLWAMGFFSFFGLIEIDVDIASKFVVRHSKWRWAPGGKWQRYTDSEIERAFRSTQ